ncbi:PLC-like phosphodiesterase [Pseudoneurospora amorphoporcata]|uniref:PLC-like phosphodiesterase n=1 Tax=Pseudoneurospora amorphoporcata TaxID=241081 RepID=A0AAN6P2I6_9PEZI|nr:PLC-like phosphodiesterase [Pseudoneurospora amorphoporcata]
MTSITRRLGCLLGMLSLGTSLAHGEAISTINGEEVTILTGTKTEHSTTSIPTNLYQTYTTRITLGTTTGTESSIIASVSGNGTDVALTSASASETSSATLSYLTGTNSHSTSTSNATASSTESPKPVPTNTRPCNNYPEFCDRKYSNITEVGCHNSPFVRANSVAANQQLGVIDQLNDGVRFLQAQIQFTANDSVPHFCHTTCDLLDAGPITEWLTTVKDWVVAHPYDVVTILLGNGNYSTPDFYVPHIEKTGILRYVFTPPVIPMALDDWPTLSHMILTGQRVVMFMDYMANQTAYPWLLDQFSQMWETPFDPVDQNFPCVVQRPPDLPADQAKNRLYLMNHNLNGEANLLGNALSVPDLSRINVTNAAEGFGSLGLAANNCRSDWGRAPNVLNVDYYNMGEYPGSVFEAAAKVNNVTYNRKCCGEEASSADRIEAVLKVPLTLGLMWAAFWTLV